MKLTRNTLTVLFHNVRSLSKHVYVIASHDRTINNDIIGFTETQINPSDSTSKIIETFEFFKYYFNSGNNKFLSLAYRCRNNVVLAKFDANGVSIFSFKKHAFVGVFTLILICRK